MTMLDFTGKTAMVTGASAGLGREMARILAREVSTLVLVARRRERLDELAAELARPGLKVLVRPADLLDRAATGAMLDGLLAEGVAVDVLINNAGFGVYGLFEQNDEEKLWQMLELNMVSATFVLRRLLPPMVARGFGAILNVGSMAGVAATPGFAAYGATKAYLNHLSDAMRGELAGTGVTLTTLAPGPVPTEFQEVAGVEGLKRMPKILEVTAEVCCAQAIDGLRRGKARVIPGLLGVAVGPIEAVPKALLRPFMRVAGKRMRDG